MQRVRARVRDRPQHPGHIQVGLRGRHAIQRHGLVRRPDVHGVPVRGRVHRDAGQARVTAGPSDPDRDLPPVGDQDLAHAARLLTRALRPSGYRQRPGEQERRQGQQSHPGQALDPEPDALSALPGEAGTKVGTAPDGHERLYRDGRLHPRTLSLAN